MSSVPAPTPFTYLSPTPSEGRITPTSVPASATATPPQASPPLVVTRLRPPAWDFTLPTLNGDTLSLSDLRGQIVLINFWANWCTPCRLEMPAIEILYTRSQAQGLTVLGVNVEEPADIAREFVDELGLSFPILLDSDGTVNRLYAVMGLPTSFFIDREGMIYQQQIGAMREEDIEVILHEMNIE